MKEYAVKPVASGADIFFNAENISLFPWGGAYRPMAQFSLMYAGDALHLALRAWEPRENLRAQARGIAHDVWHDSCLECFLMPQPENDARYMNFEFNPSGAMCLGIGSGREDKVFLAEAELSRFQIEPFCEETAGGQLLWGVTVRLELSFLHSFFPTLSLSQGVKMRANFYKCGEKTIAPHYACWSPVSAPAPDFHRPDCFGLLTFV